MNIFTSHYLYLKNEASLLLKHALESETTQESALLRFRQLEQFSALTADQTETIQSLQLKHAFQVIALENGYDTWAELKSVIETAASVSPLAEINEQFYPKYSSAFWNIWFANYKSAKEVHRQGKGILLPYKNQFFICETYFVDQLGIPADLPEWNAIGNDWVHPNHVKSWLRLNDMYASIIGNAKYV